MQVRYKKIFTVILVIALMFQIIPRSIVIAFSDKNISFNTANTANAVLNYVLDEEFFESDPEAMVTRAQFVAALVNALKAKGANNLKGFTDVRSNDQYAEEIYSALMLGWISHGDYFYPNKEISYNEAVKIVVAAIGYSYIAEVRGGYPVGYLIVAKDNKLLKNITQAEEKLSVRNAEIMIYNVLNSDIRYTGISNGINIYKNTGETFLNALYNIFEVTGIVTSTSYNSYRTDAKIHKNKYLEINGEAYLYEDTNPNLLGLYVTAFYIRDEKKVIAVVPEEHEEISFNLKNFKDLEKDILYFYDEESDEEISCKIARDCILLYNGRAVNGLDASFIQGDAGRVRLIDNDNDKIFDYIFVESYSYMVVEGYDARNKVIGDKNDNNNVLKVDDNEAVLSIYDSKNNLIEFDDLKIGQVLAVAASKDGKLIKIVVCDQVLYGEITSIDLNDDKVYINDEAYNISNYAYNYYSHLIEVGISCNFKIGINNDIVSIDFPSKGFKYGYLVDAKLNRTLDDGKVQLKIFTQEGEMKILPADKVCFDGDNNKKEGKDILTALSVNGIIHGQLIRYSVNNKGYVDHIDLYEENFDFINDDNLEENNRLRKFNFPVTSFRYRSSPKSCSPYFNLNGSIIFKIPNDLKTATDKDFFIYSSDDLVNDHTYSFEVYDLQKSGTASALVLKYDIKDAGFTSVDRSYIVERVTEGILPDGSIGKIISCFTNGTYYEFYMDNSIEVKKDSGTGLCPGDIIEIKADKENCVTAIMVDFDASNGIPVVNSFSNVTFENATSNKTYQYGSVYYSDGTYAYLSNYELMPGVYRYTFDTLKNFYIKTSNVVKINKKRDEVRPITSEEIKSYTAFGNDAHFIVIRQSYQAPQMIFVYE